MINQNTTLADIVRSEGEWSNKGSNDEWIKVTKRKNYKNRFIGKTGTDTETGNKFKAAEIKIPLFISNVDKEASENDITEYIYRKTQERVTLVKMAMKKDKGYNAYKLYVTKHKLSIFLNDAVWPSGITFRLFVNFKEKRRDELNSNIRANEATNNISNV